jgi:hypothetical protein
LFIPGDSRDGQNSTNGDQSKFTATKGLPRHGSSGTFENFYRTTKEIPVHTMSTKHLSPGEKSRQEFEGEDSLNRRGSKDSIHGKYFVKSKYHGATNVSGKPRMFRANSKDDVHTSLKSKVQVISNHPNHTIRTFISSKDIFPYACTRTNEHSSEMHTVYSARYGQNKTFSSA